MNLLTKNELKMIAGGGPGDTDTLEPGGGSCGCHAFYDNNGKLQHYGAGSCSTAGHEPAPGQHCRSYDCSTGTLC